VRTFVIVVFIVAIIASLFSALFYVFKDRETGSKRAVKALALRVGLSVTLFVLLMVTARMGWLK
jgi:4-hydroxybenzoate polyprenyltransferase